MNSPTASIAAPTAGANQTEEQRPFELVRYFSVTSLVIILLFTMLISSVLSRRSSEQVLLKREQYALLLAENLNHQVFTRFIIPTIRNFGGINVGKPEQFKLLDDVVRNTIHSFNVQQVNILDLEGNVIYSNQSQYIRRVANLWKPFQIAASGGHTSLVVPPVGFFELGGGPPRVLKTYIPLRDEKRLTAELGAPHAVFEITLDISNDFREVWVSQIIIVGTLLLMMILLFMILRSIVHRGQRIMAQRADMEVKLKEQLNQSERLAALGRMVAGVAHEIRNPLGIVRSTAELLGSRVDPAQKALAEVIVEESNRLNRTVTEFLDFARPQNPEMKPLELERILANNLHVLAPEAERLGVEVKRRYQKQPVKIVGDSDLLYRAFLNIFNNALQAMDEKGGTLSVSTHISQQGSRRWVVAAVEDTGPGFTLESMGRLMDPFFTTKEKGTGLGLSIVNNIIISLHGRLELKNSNSGGARVEVWLPAAEM